MGLLPRRNYESRIKTLNFQIAELASEAAILYRDLGHVFLNEENKVNEAFFSDGLHPNADGYLKLREELRSLLAH